MRASNTAIAVLATVVVHSSAQAQGLPPQPSWGIISGLNSSTFSGRDVTMARRKLATLVGADVVVPVTGLFSFQVEGLLTMKGDRAVSARYLEVPILARLERAIPGTPVRPFLYGGVATSVLLSCSVVSPHESPQATTCSAAQAEPLIPDSYPFGVGVENAPTHTPVNRIDYGFVSGGGLAIDLSPRATLSLGVRYTAGANRLTDEADSMNSVVSILAGLQFPVGR